MRCPRCEAAVLDERERDGVVVDACPSCRGIWLDRGELEKLIARAARDLDELRPPRDERPYRRDDDYDDDRYRHPRRKRSFLESLGDIFD
jgi:Zn-finger nucleic acid-binding protein